MRDTHLDLRSHFMTHRRYIYIETLHFDWLNISLIGYIMIYHKNHRIEVPICSYQASPSLPPLAEPIQSLRRSDPPARASWRFGSRRRSSWWNPRTRRDEMSFLLFLFFWGWKKNLLKNVTLMSRLRMCPHISQIPKWFMEYCRATEPGRIRKTVCPWIERKLRPTSKWFIARVACWLLGSCSYCNTRKKTRVEVWLYPMTLANILDKKRLV